MGRSQYSVLRDEVFGHLFCGEALVLENVGVSEESFGVDEGFLALTEEELVHSNEPRGIGGLTIGLGSVVGVTVGQVLVCVAHVLACVDLVEFSLAVCDFEEVTCALVLILS